MISDIKVTGINYEPDENVKKYAIKKAGHLDRYLPKHAKKSVVAEVRLRQVDHAHNNKYHVEVKLIVPGKVIKADDKGGNALAAIDVVERKIQAQLREYKQQTITHLNSRRILARFKRSFKRGE